MIFREIDQIRIPALGFGTYPLKGRACVDAVSAAIDVGYRHFDTAQLYENEAEVGEAIASSGCSRKEFFVTTKVWMANLTISQMQSSIDQSLKKMKLDQVDLLMIHWPSKDMDLEFCLDTLAAAQKAQQARFIGVCNFSIRLLQKALALRPGLVRVHQFENHPHFHPKALMEFGRQNGLLMTSYSPLARGQVTKDQTLIDIGRKYGKTASQVTLRWHLQLPGQMAIPKAAGLERIQNNFSVFDFSLSDSEMNQISNLGPQKRLIDPSWDHDWE